VKLLAMILSWRDLQCYRLQVFRETIDSLFMRLPISDTVVVSLVPAVMNNTHLVLAMTEHEIEIVLDFDL
jgi:hypothetical protein